MADESEGQAPNISSGSRGVWIGELDGLRGLAALAVVLAHYNPTPLLFLESPLYWFLELIRRLSFANLGVVFFYALSAFLLTYLGVREYDRYGSFNVKRFYVRRCLRIWPLYFTLLAINLVVAAPGSVLPSIYTVDDRTWSWTTEHLWMFLTFLSNWSLAFDRMFGYVDQSTASFAVLWSIAVEEQFYLFYPVLLLSVRSSRRGGRTIFIVLAVTGLVFRYLFLFFLVGEDARGPSGGMYYATLSYADIFLAGGVAGGVFARRVQSAGVLGKVIRRRETGVALFGMMVMLGVVWENQLSHPLSIASTVLYGVTGVLFALLILWVAANGASRVCRFLRSAPMRGLGRLSFGAYLWHPIIDGFVQFHLGPLSTGMRGGFVYLALFLIYLGGTLGAAVLTYGLVERPFLVLKDRFISAARPARAAEPG